MTDIVYLLMFVGIVVFWGSIFISDKRERERKEHRDKKEDLSQLSKGAQLGRRTGDTAEKIGKSINDFFSNL